MKKYFGYILFFMITFLFLYDNTQGAINFIGGTTEDAKSGGCSETSYCASDVKNSGLRISLISKNGLPVLKTKTVNFWSSNEAANFVNGSTNSIKVSSSNKYGCTVTNYNKKADSITSFDNVSTNIGLQALVGSNGGYLLPAAWVTSIENSASSDTIAKTIIAVLTETTSDSASNIDLLKYKDYFFKVEPIFIVKENYAQKCNYYSGTSYEIMEMWNTVGASFGDQYVSGGCNATIQGSWNVIRNYAVSLYLPCSERDAYGLTKDIACYSGESLTNYKAEGSYDYSRKKCYISSESKNGTTLEYFNNNIFNSGSVNGIGVGYLSIEKSFIKNGTLYIKKINSVTKQLISSAATEFTIYKGENCTGDVEKKVTTSAGEVTVSLPAGTYSVYESGVPSKYNAPYERCVINSVTIASGGKINKTVENEPTCEQELADLGETPTPSQLINLYVKYKTQKNLDYRRLLDFSNNGKNARCRTNTNCGEFETGCLTAKKETTGTDTFTFENLVCYDGEIISTSLSQPYGFCKDQLSVNNIFGSVTKFYTKNGQFLIQELNDEGKIQYYSLIDAAKKQIKLEEKNNNYIANAVVTKQCYFLNGYGVKEQSPLSLELYFGDNNADGNSEKLKKQVIQEEPVTTNHTYFTGVKYVNKVSFSFNPTYVNKITGRVSDTKTEKTVTKYGIVSKFDPNVTFGTIPFKVKFGTEEKENNSCTFETFEQIPEYNLEFRIIDTQNPFVGKSGNFRDTNTNWCHDNDCSFDNELVRQIIKSSTNSFGMKNGTKQEPIYKITLTSADIKLIRKYNEENKYDNYTMYCRGENDCVNAFVHDLKQGTLRKYDTVNFISGTKKVYGVLNNKLITN